MPPEILLRPYARADAAAPRRVFLEDERLAREAEAAELTSDVSIIARPFFERAGFAVVGEQHPALAGVALMSFRMRLRPA